MPKGSKKGSGTKKAGMKVTKQTTGKAKKSGKSY